MTFILKQDALIADQAIQVAARERASALSDREWKHRLAGYGYSIRDTDDGKHVLETLPHHVALCELPEEMFH
ncbi:MAG: hypothetical protein ABJJ53_11205 [Sulfitobacter sp.]